MNHDNYYQSSSLLSPGQPCFQRVDEGEQATQNNLLHISKCNPYQTVNRSVMKESYEAQKPKNEQEVTLKDPATNCGL